jgi:hypothetical protein
MNDAIPADKDPKALLLEREMARFQSGIRNLLLREARRRGQAPALAVDSERPQMERNGRASWRGK